MARRVGCKFVPLQDAHTCINMKVNITAIVLEFGFPKTTTGTDLCRVLRIIDDTHHQTGTTVIFFAKDAERFPRLAAHGDIIQLWNVVVRTHEGELNLVSYKSSSFALYKGDHNAHFVPYQASSDFHPTHLDQMSVHKLRKWWLNFQLREDPSGFPMFRQIKEGSLNLVCKILHCSKAANDEWFVFVWDGTDAPPNGVSSMLEDELYRPLPLQLEPLPLPRDLLCTLPTVGSILRITFDKLIKDNQLHVLKIGKWAKFINLHLEVHNGLWCGVFKPCTMLRYTPNNDFLSIERLRLYDERMSLKLRTMHGSLPQSISSLAQSSCITEVDHDRVRCSTLMDVLTHPEVPAKFKCMVRVVAILPHQPDNLCNSKGIYRMRLTLEDPTARIHALVYDTDGEYLFGGYPSLGVVTKKLNRLLGVADDDSNWEKDTARNPPWIDVCIKSYYLLEIDVWGSRNFRIFDTKIVGGGGDA